MTKDKVEELVKTKTIEASKIEAIPAPFPKTKGNATLKVLNDDQSLGPAVALLTMEPGSEIPRHLHERTTEMSYVLDGDFISEGISAKPVRVAGRFCGAGLCGDLGAAPPVPKAWVLFDDVTAVWVIGKEPAGKGWRLDPTYRADTTRWLEVTGRVEPCGAAKCLRAKSVALVPRESRSDSTPR